MTEPTESEEQKPKGKLSLSRPGRLELNKTIKAGQVRQSFSHGRSKSVAVEVRRKRTFKQSADGAMTEIRAMPGEPEVAAEATAPVIEDEAATEATTEEERKAAGEEIRKRRGRIERNGRPRPEGRKRPGSQKPEAKEL